MRTPSSYLYHQNYRSMRFVPGLAVLVCLHFVCSLSMIVALPPSIMLASELTLEVGDRKSSAGQGVPIGNVVADFRLTDSLGKEWALSDFKSKKAVVFAFLGTQCPLAKLYSSKLVELQKQYDQRGIAFVAVNSNVQDSLAEMNAHARKYGIEFPFLKDPSQELAGNLGATRTPEVCVVDQQQRIRYRGRIDDQYGIGYTKDAASKLELVDAIESILGEREIVLKSAPASGCLIGRGPRDAEAQVAQDHEGASSITYANQVSRILQARCVSCHRTGEIGPMDLSSYDDAAAWGDMIAEVVDDRRMPPWHASPEHGDFKNDRRLPDSEIDAIKKWVMAGAPRGDSSQEPPPLKFVDGWQLPREPDLVVAMNNKPFEVPARGDVKYQYFVADPNLTEDTWVNGMEIVAGNPSIVHHILVFVRDKGSKKKSLNAERGFLAGYVPGTRVELMPKGMAKRIPANSELVFQIHYTPNGTAQTDLSKIGFWKVDTSSVTHEVQTTSSVQPELKIPPNEANYKTAAMQPEELPECELLSMSPHMHVRGKSFRYSAIYPDGRREILIDVPRYDFNWQTEYRLKDNLKIPAGTRIFCEASFDNSAGNLNNPDPNSWVYWGDQTYEEMMIGYFHISVPVDPSLGRGVEVKKAAAPKKPTAMQIFLMLDSDQDGRLLKSEIPKQLISSFEKLDKNRDGVLEKSEVPK
jgi:peroxiredoxin/mono/diheme cytochrome c family protein